MGRQYKGDINGKFWFAIQDADTADRFGVRGFEPTHLVYYFEEQNLPEVEKEIANIKKGLGDYLNKLDDFFTKNYTFTTEALAALLDVSEARLRNILKEYADLDLGLKIRDTIIEKGYCSFDAEY